MPFNRPTLSQIVSRVEGDFKYYLELPAIIRRGFLYCFARTFAGVAHTLHGHIAWAVEQLLPDNADPEYVLRWANIFGVDRKAATFTILNVQATGTTGGTIPDEVKAQRSDGAKYVIDGAIVVPAGDTAAGVVVAEIEGQDGNMTPGEKITLVSAVGGVNTELEILSVATEGEEEETIEELRTRVIERMQQPPSGGKATDYIGYAKTVAGVTRAWVLPGHLGEGTVGLAFVEDNEEPIIPDQAKVDEVQAAVELLKPITANLYTFAPIANPINPVIAIDPNNLEVQAAIEAELDDLVYREAQVRDAYRSPGVEYTGIIPLSKINEAISVAAGEDDHVLLSPTSDVVPGKGGIITKGNVTFQPLV